MVAGAFAADPVPPPQPVYIVLYSRFYDHSGPHINVERVQRLLPLLERLHAQYPDSGISAALQFSGTVAETFEEENSGLHLVDRLKDLSNRNLVDIGYTGEEEPSLLYRPKPELLLANTPEARWAAKAEAAEKFLTDFKNPVTGLPVAGLSGGLKRTQEIFGPVVFATGLTATVSGDSPTIHELRKLLPSAVLNGILANDPRRGIEGTAVSNAQFSMFMSPEPAESPEAFWEDGYLRLSESTLADNRPHSTDEGPDALKRIIGRLDRSHVRVIKLEVATSKRYLSHRTDGSIVADPLEWMYYHPDNPVIPIQMHAYVTQFQVEQGYKKDEATLKWLLDEYLPANPGSRFISIRELSQMAVPAPRGVSAAQVKQLATNLNESFISRPMMPPDYAKAGNEFFSLAESFEILAKALAGMDKGGAPETVALNPVYGPLTMPDGIGPYRGSVSVADIIKAAGPIAKQLADTEWKVVPANAVPAEIAVGSEKLNAAQFLCVMARAYLDPAPEKVLTLNTINLASPAAFMFPKNTPITDQGNSWTFKPAPLKLDALKKVHGPAGP